MRMTGNRGIPGRRKPAQVLESKPGETKTAAPEAGPHGDASAGLADPHAADVRVEDLGNGRARLSAELSWPLALKVLDFLKDSSDRRNH